MLPKYKSGSYSPARIATERAINECLKQIQFADSILEVGSKNSVHRTLLNNKKYISIDIVAGKNVDLVADVHDLPFENESFDLIMCVEVLEHLRNPARAINEMFRCLNSNGAIILSTRFLFPLHPDPYDYYRFTPDSLKLLFDKFKIIKIYPVGNVLTTLSMIFLHLLPRPLQKHYLFSWLGYLPIKSHTRFACGYVVLSMK